MSLKISTSFLWLLLLPLCLVAQGDISFDASTDAKQVLENGYFEVSFTLNNADGNNFKAPSFNNFVVVSGPNQAMSTSNVNGRWSKSISYSYTLQPKKKGTFKIGPASIRVKGKMMKTVPLTIKVVKSQTQGQQTQTAYIKAEPSATEAIIGQQIILNYKLYTTVNVENYNVLSESKYPGFFPQEIRRYNANVIQEVIDGVQFSTKVLKRVALFPQQAGLLTVEPMNMQLGIAKNNAGKRRSFFFNRDLTPMRVNTEAVEINVKPLPTPSPRSFTGAVGKYNMLVAIDKASITTDDAISLKVTITGTGDIKRVQAPNFNFSDSLEIYDPRVVEENTFENAGFVTGKKIFEYLVIPKHPGRYAMTPEISYFDTDSLKYITLAPRTHRIFVRPGSGKSTSALRPEAAQPTEEIRFINTNTSLQKVGSSFLGSGLFWSLFAFPFFLLGGVLVYKKILQQKSNIDISVLKKHRAQKVALQRLQVAEKHLKAQESKSFYDEVSRAMLGYVCDKLSIPTSELTKENVRDSLQSLKVRDELTDQFLKIIQTCEMALFAGMDNANAMQETYSKSVEVLSGIEEEIGK